MKVFIKENWFKLLAIALLMGSVGEHPYSYYQVLRWVVTVSSGYTAYTFFNSKNNFWGWVFVAVAILFNPISSFYFARETWLIMDLVGAAIFLISLFIKRKKLYEKT